MATRIGLSRHQRPAQLLSQVNGKQREKLEEKVDDDAPPISSAEEDNGDDLDLDSRKPVGTNRLICPALDPVSDESEPERDRASMRRTTFGSSRNSRTRSNGTRSQRSSTMKDSIVDDSDETPPTSNKRRKLNVTSTNARVSTSAGVTASKSPSSSNPYTDEHGFITRKKSETYGTRKKNGPLQGSRPNKGAKQDTRDKTAKFRPVDDFSSPQKPRRARLAAPEEPVLSSPSKGQRPTFKRELNKDDADDDLFDSPKQRRPSVTRISSSQGSQSSIKPKTGVLWSSQQKLMKKVQKEAEKNPPKPVRAKFKMPAEIPDFERGDNGDAGSGGSPLSDLSDLEPLSDEPAHNTPASEASDAEESVPDDPMTQCPWCGELVEKGLLKDFSKGKRLNVRMQSKFCLKHKKETAMDTWRSRHYPTVHWATLEQRFAEHHGFLLDIVNGQSSYFRDVLADKIKSGKAARSLKKEENLNPGYYGPRGFNLMCDYLVGEFSDLLKEAAVSDRVIAGRGTPAFIQSVLVAELAVRLIGEDMDVSDKEAREIMLESKALGEIVHEEV